MRRLFLRAVVPALLTCVSCSQPEVVRTAQGAEAVSPPRVEATPAPVERPSSPAPRIVFLGDSLTAGYGLAKDESVTSLIQKRLRAGRYPVCRVTRPLEVSAASTGRSRET